MYRIALINMPFASAQLPSIALTQLRAALSKTESRDRLQCDLYYLNHDFVEYFGREDYSRISDSVHATVSGLGDYLFRHVAFADQPDNFSEYRRRYSWMFPANSKVFSLQENPRHGIGKFLDELIDRYQLDQCSLVGFTSMFAQNMASFAMARRLKQRNADIRVAIGGANCEATMGLAIARNVEWVDFVFSGPSLKTFPKLVQHLINAEQDECHKMAGVFTRDRIRRDALMMGNEIGAELHIDEDLPLDYRDFLESADSKCPDIKPALLFETSRGCWWGERAHCTFCGLNGTTMKYRAMSPDKAVSQFRELFNYYPRVTRFKSVDNILPREYLSSVLPRLSPPKDITIFYETKADLNNEEMKVLADARVVDVQPGIEALASSTLKLMKKGTTVFQNLRFLKACVKYGIKPSWNLLIGFPGEPEEVYERYLKNLPLLTHLPPPSGVYPVRFDRFSPYFNLAQEYGLKLQPLDFYFLLYPFAKQDVAELAYFFTDTNYRNAYIGSTAKWIRKLEAAVREWNNGWKSPHNRQVPALTVEQADGAWFVRDSRSAITVEHPLKLLGVRILRYLETPMARSQLAKKFDNEVTAAEVEAELDELRQKSLVFEEGDRLMALTVDSMSAAADADEIAESIPMSV